MEGHTVAERSYIPLEEGHLRRLVKVALEDLKSLFERCPETGELYRDRLLALCLCQGGAEHFVRGKNGVKDLDVWAFFAKHDTRPFPYRRVGKQDFGVSSLGRHPNDFGFVGRRVDIIGRSLPLATGLSAQDCIRLWLQGGKSKSAREISKRPVVMLFPEQDMGSVLWDPCSDHRQ